MPRASSGTSLAGYLHADYIGVVPMFFILLLVQGLFIGFETRGRTIEELDAALTRSKPLAAEPG